MFKNGFYVFNPHKNSKKVLFKGLKTDFTFLATVAKYATVLKFRTVQLVGNIDRFKEFK